MDYYYSIISNNRFYMNYYMKCSLSLSPLSIFSLTLTQS